MWAEEFPGGARFFSNASETQTRSELSDAGERSKVALECDGPAVALLQRTGRKCFKGRVTSQYPIPQRRQPSHSTVEALIITAQFIRFKGNLTTCRSSLCIVQSSVA